MAKTKKPTKRKKPARKPDLSQTALSIVERITGGKLVNPKPTK